MNHRFARIAPNFRLSAMRVALIVMATCMATALSAQTSPTANTFSSLAGGYTGTYTAGAVCGGATSGSTYVSTDTLGNGCPGQYAKFGSTLSAMGVDGAGNVYVVDSANSEVRKVDAKSGIVTRVAGGGTNCGSANGQADSYGAGCPLLQTALPGSLNVRGTNVDSYGNVILAAYSGSAVEVLCLSQSPLCPNTAGRKQVGNMYRVAGCVASQTTGGATDAGAAYAAGDGQVASPFENLAGDVADWGAGAVVGAAGTQTCSTSIAGVTQPRNATADRYGNVWIADTGNSRYRVVLGPATYNSITNPMYAIIQLNPKYPTAHYGYIYPIMGTFTAFTQSGTTYNIPSAAGGACSSATGAATSTDTYGDGCPFFSTTTGSSVAGLTVDLSGNVIFLDNAKQLVRVLYVGGATMANLIKITTGLTAVQGSIYAIEGFGSNGLTTTPVLGTSAGNFSYDTKGAVDQFGNIYIGNNGNTSVYVIDAVTGYMRLLFATGAACAAKKDSVGDGCLAGAAPFISAGGSIGLPIGIDNLNNFYIGDNAGYIRKVLSTSLYPTAVGSSFTQSMLFHQPVGTTSIAASLLNASPGITISGTPTCVLNTASTSDSTADCTVTVVFAPITPGLASATLAIVNTGGGGATTLYPVTGQATDAVLVTDVATPATSTFATIGNPSSLTFDGAGNLYTIDKSTTSIKKVSPAGTITTVGTAPSAANQIAVDPSGNVYVTAIGSTAITKFTLSSSGSYSTATTFTAAVNGGATTITAYAISGNVATFTAANTLAAGQTVTLSGFPNSTFFNGQTATVLSVGLSTTQFEVNFTNANASATETGYASTAAGVASPQGIAFDAQGNEYVSDATTKAVYQVPNDAGGGNLQSTVMLATDLANPTLLTFDGLGNLLVADTSAVYRINSSTGALSTVLSGITPAGIAADAGGNAYIQDGGSKKVLEVPYQAFAPDTVIVLTGETTPSGLAVDGKGQIYAADSGLATPAIIRVLRAAATYTFPTPTTKFSGTFTNAGNANATGYAQTDASEFPYTGTGSGGCGTISSSSVLTTGGSCLFSVTPNLGNNGALVTNTTTLTPAASLGSLALTAQEPSGTTYTTTTSISGPTSATYATGTEITFAVSEVASDNSTQTGIVSVTVDAGTAAAITSTPALTNGSASVPLSGLSAGPHSIVASYPGNGTYLTSTSATLNFTINQAATSVSWSPGATTQNYSAALGASVLNATSSTPGTFIYTATPSGGNAQNVHSASYLPIGTYSLGVTFVPNNAVNYAQSNATVPSYTVTQAPTTAGLGATQTLVASDGTGNFTNMQAAVNAIGSGGGSIYIKPGTYTGDITVVQPNVAFRGLGGDPTKVILTHAGGAFGASGVYQYAGEFNSSQNNGAQLPSGSSLFSGDQGSATLVVARGINTALSTSQLIPNGFYAENLSLINSYNTDATLTTTFVSSGNCTANAGAAQTYSALYNAGIECASQALAIWTTSDLTVMNNVYATSLQDTIYTASPGQSNGAYLPSRQYWFRGKVTGDVDYIFGDAAAVFDSTSIYSAFHGTAASGTITIEAQNKAQQTGSTSDYLSGYVMNNGVFTSQAPNMTSLYFGRPYGNYSTWIMLNSYVDQVTAAGYTTGLGPTLTSASYGEFNDIQYTDPTPNTADLNGNLYLGAGGNTGSGVTGTRENVNTNPGTNFAGNNPATSLSLAQAQAYFPTNFLSQTVSSAISSTTNWNPTAALAASVNAFTTAATVSSIAGGSSVTFVMRPQTPGLGVIVPAGYNPASPTPAVFTVPTGTYTLTDTFNSATTMLASGSLDGAGEAYFISSSLAAGTHSLQWTYSGDTNFAASTSAAYSLVVGSTSTATTLSGSGVVYGQSASVKATVSAASGTPTGSVTLTTDSSSNQSLQLASGMVTFTVPGLLAGTHSFSASYAGNSPFGASSTSSNLTLAVTQFPLTVTGSCTNRVFGQSNACSATVATYQYSDSSATVFSIPPAATTTALRNSPAGTYTATPTGGTLSSFGSANYTETAANGMFTIAGGAPQVILFSALPNFATGSYQLTARATSGLPIVYTVTGTGASISGTTLTLSGATGATITVTANTTTDPTGDYAPAPAVARSFTAQ